MDDITIDGSPNLTVINGAAERLVYSVDEHLDGDSQKELIELMLSSLDQAIKRDTEVYQFSEQREEFKQKIDQLKQQMISDKVIADNQVASREVLARSFVEVSELFWEGYKFVITLNLGFPKNYGLLLVLYGAASDTASSSSNSIFRDFFGHIFNGTEYIKSSLVAQLASQEAFTPTSKTAIALQAAAKKLIDRAAEANFTQNSMNEIVNSVASLVPDWLVRDYYKAGLSQLGRDSIFIEISKSFFARYLRENPGGANTLYKYLATKNVADETQVAVELIKDLIPDGKLNKTSKALAFLHRHPLEQHQDPQLSKDTIEKLEQLFQEVLKGPSSEYCKFVVEHATEEATDLTGDSLLRDFYYQLHFYVQKLLGDGGDDAPSKQNQAINLLQEYLKNADANQLVNIKKMIVSLPVEDGTSKKNIDIQDALNKLLKGRNIEYDVQDVLLQQHHIQEFIKNFTEGNSTKEYLNSVLESFEYSTINGTHRELKLLKEFCAQLVNAFDIRATSDNNVKNFSLNYLQYYYDNHPNKQNLESKFNKIKTFFEHNLNFIDSEYNTRIYDFIIKNFITRDLKQGILKEAIKQLVYGPTIQYQKLLVESNDRNAEAATSLFRKFSESIGDHFKDFINGDNTLISDLNAFLNTITIDDSQSLYKKRKIIEKLISGSSVNPLNIELNIMHQSKTFAERINLGQELFQQLLSIRPSTEYQESIVKYISKSKHKQHYDNQISIKKFLEYVDDYYILLVGKQSEVFTSEMKDLISSNQLMSHRHIISDALYNFLQKHDFDINKIEQQYSSSTSLYFKELLNIKRLPEWQICKDLFTDYNKNTLERLVIKKSQYEIARSLIDNREIKSDLIDAYLSEDFTVSSRGLIKEALLYYIDPNKATEEYMNHVIRYVKHNNDDPNDDNYQDMSGRDLIDLYRSEGYKNETYEHQYIALLANSDELKEFAKDFLSESLKSHNSSATWKYNVKNSINNILTGQHSLKNHLFVDDLTQHSNEIPTDSIAVDTSLDNEIKKFLILQLVQYTFESDQMSPTYKSAALQYIRHKNNINDKNIILDFEQNQGLSGSLSFYDNQALLHRYIVLLVNGNQALEDFALNYVNTMAESCAAHTECNVLKMWEKAINDFSNDCSRLYEYTDACSHIVGHQNADFLVL